MVLQRDPCVSSALFFPRQLCREGDADKKGNFLLSHGGLEPDLLTGRHRWDNQTFQLLCSRHLLLEKEAAVNSHKGLGRAGIQREAGSGGGFGHLTLLERVWELGFGSFVLPA